jgi:CheY-like chemotaxis protein
MGRTVASKKILIVDDDLRNIATIAQILLENGYQVLHAEDKDRAAKVALNSRPDLIICNAESKTLDALQLLKTVRQAPHMRRISVLFLTDSAELLEAAPGVVGPKQYLKKPYTREQLTIAVQENLKYAPAKRKQL